MEYQENQLKQLTDGNYTLPNGRYFLKIALRNNELPKNEEDLKLIFPDNHNYILSGLKKFGKCGSIRFN